MLFKVAIICLPGIVYLQQLKSGWHDSYFVVSLSPSIQEYTHAVTHIYTHTMTYIYLEELTGEGYVVIYIYTYLHVHYRLVRKATGISH